MATLLTPLHWSEHLIKSSSVRSSPVDRGRFQVKQLAPLHQQACFAAPRYARVVALVSGLFAWCRPSAIGWAIRTVIVDAVNARSWRARTHISEECIEVKPRIAHDDAAPSVLFKVGVVPVVATRFHGTPSSILWRWFIPECVAVCAVLLQADVAAQTSATLDATLQVGRLDPVFVAAVASADPEYPSAGPVHADGRQPSESAPSQIFNEGNASVFDAGSVSQQLWGERSRLPGSQSDLLGVVEVRGAGGVSAPPLPVIVSVPAAERRVP